MMLRCVAGVMFVIFPGAASYRQQLPSVVTPASSVPDMRLELLPFEPCGMETVLDGSTSHMRSNASFTLQRLDPGPGQEGRVPLGAVQSPPSVPKIQGRGTQAESREVHQPPSLQLVSNALTEAKVFLAELLFGAAICMGAAVQRRLARARV
mmetsp:Transcript_21337/g.40154  ORF Transcript_21337/g.40154 Transcript_21337/m.40154 type:complete len:152 (-) Transcript_21337:29-484(-)